MKTLQLPLFLALALMLASCAPSDSRLSKEVKSSLDLLDSTIQVSVDSGVVTLSGQVQDESIKNAAESSIKEIKGVRSTVNNLTVKPDNPDLLSTTRPDQEIREYVNAALAANNIEGITATVKEGEITLTGNVKKADLQTVMRVANEAKPRNIRNELKIK